MSHCEEKECPICMDVIEGNKNFINTECGHCFHANCLMTSVAHNGFGCPYCRTAMAEVQEDDDDDSEISDHEEDEVDDHTLRAFRFFMNNINNEQHGEEDIEEEDNFMEEEHDEESEESVVDVPSPSSIVEKLTQQGVTMEDLVKILLLEHEEYDQQEEQNDRLSGEIFGKMRIIISNYHAELQQVE